MSVVRAARGAEEGIFEKREARVRESVARRAGVCVDVEVSEDIVHASERKVRTDECVAHARGRGSVSAGKRRDCVRREDGRGDARNRL